MGHYIQVAYATAPSAQLMDDAVTKDMTKQKLWKQVKKPMDRNGKQNQAEKKNL